MIKKLIVSTITSALCLFAAIGLGQAGAKVKAATFSDINEPYVFLKQQGSDTCTLCSNTMMLRRAALLRGDSDWDSITESALRSRIWIEGVGMYNTYSYKGFNVRYGKTSNPWSSEAELRDLLSRHPEGIVAYDYQYPHAILLTDYTDGVFYCAEPARCVDSGRVTASKAIVSVSGIEAYWYIEGSGLSVEKEKPVYEELLNKSTLSRGDMTVGESVTINANASGGSGSFEYSYSYRRLPDTAWTDIRGYSSSRSVSFRPASKGSYYIRVKIHDKELGRVVQKGLYLDVAEKLENRSKLSSDVITLDQSVTIKASAAGGSGNYQYAYYCRKANSSGWTMLKDYSSSASVSYTPADPVDYSFIVRVKDSKGRTAEKRLDLRVNRQLINRSEAASSSICLGEPMKLSASASGGTGDYQYAYYCRKSGTKGWYIIKLYSSDDTASYTPVAATEYEVMIRVRDSSGTVSEKHLTVNVRKPLENNSSVSSGRITKGSYFYLTGAASGGTGKYEYAFYCRKSGTTGWYTIRNYGREATAFYRPVAATDYEIMTRVRDSSGKVREKYLTITVERPDQKSDG